MSFLSGSAAKSTGRTWDIGMADGLATIIRATAAAALSTQTAVASDKPPNESSVRWRCRCLLLSKNGTQWLEQCGVIGRGNIGLALLATDTGQKGCVALVAHPSQRVVDILGTLLGALASLLR